MDSLTIGVDYITGRCVAADVSDRDQPEWPPHPGRLFMALAAACFETGEDEQDVAALKWLESLGAPQIYASPAENRSGVKYYVPVNDKMTVNKSVLQSTPGLTRSKQERSFPTTIPHNSLVKFVWTDVERASEHAEALARVCAQVIRLGHSSSLVHVWLEVGVLDIQAECDEQRFAWQPSSGRAGIRVRVADEGEFERLRIACNAQLIEQFGELKERIESTKGSEQKDAKKIFEAAIGTPYKASLRPPEPTPPTLGLWQTYCSAQPAEKSDQAIAGEYFDSELVILAKIDGRSLGVQDCLALTSRLRDAAMSHCPQSPTPAWLGGHDESGQPTKQPHTAFLALPFVGEHSDGHVMGLALALPAQVAPEYRGPMLGPLLLRDDGEARDINLKLAGLGTWTVRLEERTSPPKSLEAQTWTGPSSSWGSVTPVVLDRFPKSSRVDNRLAWEAEVRGIVAQSCSRSGLPAPLEIDIDTTSWHIGVPRAFLKTRPFRAGNGTSARTVLGDGFPNMRSRSGKPSRPQIHVFLRFEKPVRGPLLIGAGRFLGYGLCKPIQTRRKPS